MLFLETLDPFPEHMMWMSSTHLSLNILAICKFSSEITSSKAPLPCMLKWCKLENHNPITSFLWLNLNLLEIFSLHLAICAQYLWSCPGMFRKKTWQLAYHQSNPYFLRVFEPLFTNLLVTLPTLPKSILPFLIYGNRVIVTLTITLTLIDRYTLW